MEKYLNRSGNSPVTFFQIADDNITVWFKGAARSYRYSYKKAGRAHVEIMKGLAISGSGLSAYITRNVKYSYD